MSAHASIETALHDYGMGYNIGDEDIADLTSHIVAALSEAGLAVVALPEPDSTRYTGDEHEPADRLSWMPGDDFEVSVWHHGEVQRWGYGWGDDEPLSVAEARTIAVALLAAANAAEAEDV